MIGAILATIATVGALVALIWAIRQHPYNGSDFRVTRDLSWILLGLWICPPVALLVMAYGRNEPIEFDSN